MADIKADFLDPGAVISKTIAADGRTQLPRLRLQVDYLVQVLGIKIRQKPVKYAT